jgi:6-pyruvoyltetrahydropterin/6-carboxytetrahydropterin synthase
MYELMIEDHFDAAHALRGYRGPCENLHGHSWRVQVFLKGDKLNKIGILVDFKDLKAKLKKVLNQFDHQNLNALPLFKKQNPSCENLARIIFEKLKRALPQLEKVTVWESRQTSASFF